MAGDDLIDRAAIDVLLANVGGDVEFLAELMDDYFLDSPEQLSAMRQALNSGDAVSFRRAAHSLKTNSASFGATQLGLLCKELEELGKTDHLTDVEEILNEVEVLFDQTKPALEAALKEVKG